MDFMMFYWEILGFLMVRSGFAVVARPVAFLWASPACAFKSSFCVLVVPRIQTTNSSYLWPTYEIKDFKHFLGQTLPVLSQKISSKMR